MLPAIGWLILLGASETLTSTSPQDLADAPKESAADPGPSTIRDDAGPRDTIEPLEPIESEPDELGPPLGVQTHALVSQGFIKTTANNYLAKSERGSFEFTEVALNFTRELTDDLRAGVQFFARDLGPIGNYDAKFDWFYLDYRWRDWLGVRVGRVKLPFGLYNEVSDADSERVPVLLPQSIYPIENRDILLAQTGGEIYGYVPVSAAGAIEYRAYGGAIFIEADTTKNGPLTLRSIDTRYLLGARVLWETPIEGLRAGGSVQALRLDSLYQIDDAVAAVLRMAGIVPADFAGTLTVEIPFLLWVASVEYRAGGLHLAAEYGRWHATPTSDQPALFPDVDVTNERFYVMASHRLAEWLVAGAYYSLFVPDVDEREGRSASQEDFAVSLRFDVDTFWLIKLEGHAMRGTAALTPALNDGRPLEELARSWGLFLAKTTLFF